MKKCPNCKKYTLKPDCYACKSTTLEVSNKYLPLDKYFNLRIKEYIKGIKKKI